AIDICLPGIARRRTVVERVRDSIAIAIRGKSKCSSLLGFPEIVRVRSPHSDDAGLIRMSSPDREGVAEASLCCRHWHIQCEQDGPGLSRQSIGSAFIRIAWGVLFGRASYDLWLAARSHISNSDRVSKLRVVLGIWCSECP